MTRSLPRRPFLPRQSLGARLPALTPHAEVWGPSAWSLGEVGIKAYVEENQFFDVNPNGPIPNWPQTVSATGNTVSPATVALTYAQTGLGNAEDPYQLMKFLNKGGKVVWYHGASDSLITPFRSFWFYEQLASVMGGYDRAQDSVRLFIEPGMDHCGGGVSPNSFDTLQALDKWVTKGEIGRAHV